MYVLLRNRHAQLSAPWLLAAAAAAGWWCVKLLLRLPVRWHLSDTLLLLLWHQGCPCVVSRARCVLLLLGLDTECNGVQDTHSCYAVWGVQHHLYEWVYA